LAGLLSATLLFLCMGLIAGATTAKLAGGKKLAPAFFGLAAVIALHSFMLFFFAAAWVQPGVYAGALHAVWAMSAAAAIGLAFFIGHRHGSAPPA